MIRVLFVAPTPPWPRNNGGRIRTSGLLRPLSRDHEITLWCVAKEHGEDEGEDISAQLCSHFELFPRTAASPLRQLSGPIQEQWFTSKDLERRLGGLQADDYDVIHLDELCLIRHFPAALSIPLVQHHHKLDLELAADLGMPGARLNLELERWKLMERECLARTSQHVFCSDIDADRFTARHQGIQSHVVPNGVDSKYFDITGVPRHSQRLLLLGDLDYGPNRRGIATFLETVWPELRRSLPELQVSIVGRGEIPEKPESLPAGVEWIGHVPDVRPWLSSATALVVPLDVGGGTRLKILEATAARCPVLTTHVGLEGLDFVPGEHVVAVDKISDLKRVIVDCVNYPERAAGRAIYAKDLVAERYEWSGISKGLAATWQQAIDEFPG